METYNGAEEVKCDLWSHENPSTLNSPQQGNTLTPVVSRSFEHHTGNRVIFLGSTPVLRESTLGSGVSHLSFPSTSLTKELAARRLFRLPPSSEGWTTCRVAGQVDHSECPVRNCWEQWTREGTHAWKTGSGATRKNTRREDRRIVRQALVDPTVTRSTIRADVGVAIVP
ncbi:uncharacterized protein TNCV_503471 [Trichonephila clavipes]|nr:uncharacterized protein TNCV_503471 [Trichonephila clavipes]